MITPEQLQAIATSLEGQPLNDAIVTFLKTQFSNIHFTYCIDDDVSGVSPKLETPRFNLYLIDGREHCLCLTNKHEDASGVVIAEIIDD